MKAFTLKKNGGIDNLLLNDIPKPSISKGEVLVKVRAISINPVDAFVRSSMDGLRIFLRPADDDKLLIIGWDVAGVVEQVGQDVNGFKAGDEVFGLIRFPGHGKGYAEYVSVPQEHLTLKPSNVSFEEAAAATLAALTAWQGLVSIAKVKAGERVLVHAAAGGVGHYAIQIAKSSGATVTAVTSSRNHDFVTSLGADQVFDYTSSEYSDIANHADIVLDSVGGRNIYQSITQLKNGGRLVSLLTHLDDEMTKEAQKKKLYSERMVVKSSGEDMSHIASLLQSGKMRTHIDHSFSFADLPKAHQQIETRKTKGKVVVSVP